MGIPHRMWVLVHDDTFYCIIPEEFSCPSGLRFTKCSLHKVYLTLSQIRGATVFETTVRVLEEMVYHAYMLLNAGEKYLLKCRLFPSSQKYPTL